MRLVRLSCSRARRSSHSADRARSRTPALAATFVRQRSSVPAMIATSARTAAAASSAALPVRPLSPSPLLCLCIDLTEAFDRLSSGISDAYYCTECTRLEKDRDGCPKIVNLGASRTDLFYERKSVSSLPPFFCPAHAHRHLDAIPRKLGFKKG